MRFEFTDDQRTFEQHVRDMFKKECDVDTLRGAWDSDSGRIDGLWSTLAASGLTGLMASEDNGGLGLTALDFVLLLEAAGEVALPEPLMEHALVAVPLIEELAKDSDKADALLDAAIAGQCAVTTDLYGAGFVSCASTADAFLVAREGNIHLVTREAAHLDAQNSVDHTRDVATIHVDAGENAPIASGERAAALIESARLRGALGAAAELLGLSRSMVELGVEYAKVREQFGKAIGTFQAVQHRLVNAFSAEQFARPAVYRAAYSLANGDRDAALHVSMAKVMASEASDRVAREVLQVHGGIGYTTEYELHMWMKRAWALQAAWGTARSHRRQMENTLLGSIPR